MTDAEIKAIAEAAADAAIEKTLLRLGVDPDDKDGFAETRKDFAYLRRLRVGAETFKRQGISTLASVITTFVIGSLVAAAYKYWPFPTH
jgi:hypothetical protein